MKTIIKGCVLFVSLLLISNTCGAQSSVRINIVSQPVWGPVGYDYAEYYYMPEYEAYYSVPKHQFVYSDGGRWVFGSALPSRFGTVNLFSTYKVVVNQPRAYMYFKDHKVKYKGSSGKQIIIRDSKEPKYFIVKGHPDHGQGKVGKAPSAKPYKGGNQAPKGNGSGHKSNGGGKGNGKGKK